MAAKTFKRSGLHRLECQACPCYGYFTVAMLEKAGQMPRCFAPDCGAEMQPERLELALMLGVDSPIVHEYHERTIRKQMAQMPKGKRPCMRSEHLDDMGAKAAREIVAEQRHDARQRRIRAILPTPEPLPF